MPRVAPTTEVPATPAVEVVDESTDDFGYAIVADPKAPAAVVPPVVEKPAEGTPPVVEKPASGYGKEETPAPEVKPVEVVPPVEEKKLEDMTDEEKSQKEIKDSIKALDAGYDKAKIEKFVTDNKLTPVQLKAYIDLTKAEDAKYKADQAAAKVKYRNDSIAELKADVDFGGEHFELNVSRIEKLLEKNMPSTKKMLTEKGGVLPPYLMKDLLRIAKELNPVAPLVIGEAPAPDESEDPNFDEYGYTK